MEALLEKEADVESWNDERLDELSRRMDAGFEKAATKEEMKLRFDAVDIRFDEVDRRFNEIGQQMSRGFGEVNAQLARLNDRLDRFVSTFVIVSATVAAAVIGNAVFG